MKRLANQKNKIKSGIIKICQSIILSLAIILQVNFAYAQSIQGGIIPNGKATFLDQNGKPLSSGQVFFYTGNVGSTTPKTTYQDINQTIANTNPVTLDAAGRALLWGTGSYRQIVKDKNGNTIWDQITSAAGSGSSSSTTATGDGDLVGTIKPWAGITAPSQYLFTYGQQISRTTYAALFTAITSVQAVFCTSGSDVLTGLGDTTNFWVGMPIEVSCVLGGRTTITAKTSTTVTLSLSANVTTNTNATFFPWGDGDGSTTFTLPDFRGLIPMGNNIMGGVASSNISDTYFGSALAESAGAQGGNQSVALATTNLPAYTPSGTVNVGIPAFNLNNVSGTSDTTHLSVGNSGNSPAGLFNIPAIGGSSATFTGNAQGGASTPFGIIPPSKTVNFIIKVTPDANSATASGVTSLGGMTGSITCSTGVTCTGNNISVSLVTVNSLGGMTGNISCGAGLTCSSNTISVSSTGNYVTPQSYGALCDGSTDDHTALQNMLTANSGKTIFITAGTCVTSTTLTVPANTTITGAGWNAIIKTTATTGVFNATNVSHIKISNIQIQGSDNWTTGPSSSYGPIIINQNGSAIAAGTDYDFQNLKFTGFNTNYWLWFSTVGSTFTLGPVNVSNNWFASVPADAPADNAGHNGNNDAIYFSSATAGNGQFHDVTINNNRIDGTAFCIGAFLGGYITNFQFISNYVTNIGATNSNHCLNAGGTTINAYGIAVYDINSDGFVASYGHISTNSIITPYSSGIYLAGTGSINTEVNGNNIYGQVSTDDVSLPRAAISINTYTDVTVTANHLYAGYAGVVATGQPSGRITITGNDCISSVTNSFCIKEVAAASGSADYFAASNHLDAALYGAWLISATGSRFNNVSFVSNELVGNNTALNLNTPFISGSLVVVGNNIQSSSQPISIGTVTGNIQLNGNIIFNSSSGTSGITFANLPAAATNGSQIFVSDGAAGSSPCTGASTGSTAFHQNGAWKCF